LRRMLGSVFSWLSALLFRRVRLQHRVTASVCTDGHAIIGWVEDPPLQGPRHLDVSLELWVPEHRTTVREVGAEASGQTLESTDFTPMNLQPAEPQHQTVTFFPPSGA